MWAAKLARRGASLRQLWLRAAALAGLAFAATLAVQVAIGANRIPPLEGLLGLLASDFAWAWVVVWAAEHLSQLEPVAGDRRRFLLRFGAAALSLAAGGFAAGERLREGSPAAAELPPLPAVQPAIPAPSAVPPVTGGPPGATVPAAASAGAVAAVSPPVLSAPAPTPGTPLPPFAPAGGTRPNVTPIGDFYEVDIGAEAPRVEVAGWKLEVKGLVDRPLSLALEDLLALPRVDVYGTLQCISNTVGGRLIGTTLFSGVRLADVLQKAGPQAGAVEVVLRAVDGYGESMSIDQAMQGDPLLVYGMDGKILERAHGFPLRLYKPDAYGMKGPKWLVALELVAEHYQGYWERSGWDEEALVKTTSVIDSPGAVKAENGLAQVGGIAYAGWRGIKEVGVQIDGGPFAAAVLDRPLSAFTWVRWRFDWRDPSPGSHRIVVRAIDGNGDEQTPRPHRRTRTARAGGTGRA